MGGVSRGTKPEEEMGGEGTVRKTVFSAKSARELAIEAPVALISSVFVSSLKSLPFESTHRTNTGICK